MIRVLLFADQRFENEIYLIASTRNDTSLLCCSSPVIVKLDT